MNNLTHMAKVFLSRPGGRYLVVGGSVYILELATILVAQKMGASSVTSVAIAYIVGTAVSFVLQKLFTFGDRRMHHKVILSQVIAVTLLVIFNFGFTLLTAKLLQNILPAIVVRTLALLTTTIWNFFLYKTRIFKRADIQPII